MALIHIDQKTDWKGGGCQGEGMTRDVLTTCTLARGGSQNIPQNENKKEECCFIHRSSCFKKV